MIFKLLQAKMINIETVLYNDSEYKLKLICLSLKLIT